MSTLRILCFTLATFVHGGLVAAEPEEGTERAYDNVYPISVGVLRPGQTEAGPFSFLFRAGDDPAIALVCDHGRARLRMMKPGSAIPLRVVHLDCRSEHRTRFGIGRIKQDSLLEFYVARVVTSDEGGQEEALPYSLLVGTTLSQDFDRWYGYNANVVVSTGDCLWRIAERELERRYEPFASWSFPRRKRVVDCFWKLIWKANRSSIHDPNQIFPMQGIFLPEGDCAGDSEP